MKHMTALVLALSFGLAVSARCQQSDSATVEQDNATIKVQVEKELKDARSAVAQAHAAQDSVRKQLFYTFGSGPLSGLPDTRVNLDIRDVSVRDAFRRACAEAKIECKFDDDVPEDKKVSVSVRGVKIGTALDVLADLAEVSWARETSADKTVVRVGKNAHAMSWSSTGWRVPLLSTPGHALNLTAPFSGSKTVTVTVPEMRDSVAYLLSGGVEERATFTCPHCKGQVTMMRSREQPKCPKCGLEFQASWQFCPKDGTKRPRARGDWQFCPLCGKPIDTSEAPAAK